MKWALSVVLLVIPTLIFGQYKIYLGINISPLIINTIDLNGEIQLSSFLALQAKTGTRFQNHESTDPPGLKFLSDYIQRKNKAAFLSLGVRLFNLTPTEYEYPYIAFDVVGIYYSETILDTDASTGGISIFRDVNGFRIGGSFTLGFVWRLSDRIHLDLGLQLGYAPQRKEINAYYFPGLGYSTFGIGVLSIKGGHIQPLISLKYNIFKDKRQRIREMD
jgi:hypothetical protein